MNVRVVVELVRHAANTSVIFPVLDTLSSPYNELKFELSIINTKWLPIKSQKVLSLRRKGEMIHLLV